MDFGEFYFSPLKFKVNPKIPLDIKSAMHLYIHGFIKDSYFIVSGSFYLLILWVSKSI